VTGEAAAVIRARYLAGDTVEEIAAAAGVLVIEAETYLRAWCSDGCPDA
jgi:hypothetical protein